MTLLDVPKKVLGVTVVAHSSDLPGLRDERFFPYPSKREDYLFEVPSWEDEFHSKILLEGYYSLVPVCDKSVIQNRQQALREFSKDLLEGRLYLPSLNMMHIINEWSGRIGSSRSGAPKVSSQTKAKVLNRYLTEAKQLNALLIEQGGLLSKVGQEYSSRLPEDEINVFIHAFNQGEFDGLVISNQGNLEVKGVLGRKIRPDSPRVRSLEDNSLWELTGWSPHNFVDHAYSQALDLLNDFYGPLATLYFEADHMNRKQKGGQRICLPEINTRDIFEMVEGEPILNVAESVAWRSFGFDRDNKCILNGLHSGGKTQLLCDIPLYIIRGLRGFSLPAKSAKIPITRRIYQSLDIDKHDVGGSLESELSQRVAEIMEARRGDLFLIDEFLQHASPDASDPLGPIILEEYAKTRASFVIVDHRGDSIEDGGDWNFWSPGFERLPDGRINPTYKFQNGKPSKEVLMDHAKQLLEKLVGEMGVEEPVPDRREYGFSVGNSNWERKAKWFKITTERIISGRF